MIRLAVLVAFVLATNSAIPQEFVFNAYMDAASKAH